MELNLIFNILNYHFSQEFSLAECTSFWKNITTLCQENLQVFASQCDSQFNDDQV